MPTELYRLYRPRKLADVVGQPAAVKQLTELLAKKRIPHAVLLHGPSGTGKTTLARILRDELGVGADDFDYVELNAAQTRGIDDIRAVQREMSMSGFAGGNRMYVLDEAHKLTGDAQNCLLKMLEDSPEHVYFVLCTTDPKKVIATVRSRCTEIGLKPVPDADLKKLVESVLAKEKVKLSARVTDQIVASAYGGARKALVLLDAVIDLTNEAEQLAAVGTADESTPAFDLVKSLCLYGGKPAWPAVAKILKDIEAEDCEGLRNMILAAARSALLAKGSAQAFKVINIFRDPLYDNPNAARAILAANCYEACQ